MSKKRPLIAIGLDGADSQLIHQWCSLGYLPTIDKLLKRSYYTEFENFDMYRAEIPWTTFLTGVAPEKTGYWGRIQYDPSACRVMENGAYAFDEYKPFYAIDPSKNICVFDMPQTRLQHQVRGIEVLAWGAHSPRGPSVSKPTHLLSDLQSKYGHHPRLNNDHANIYNASDIGSLKRDFITGIERRTEIALELLNQENWDLFLMMYSECHSAGHTFWHIDQPHPLHGKLANFDDNYQLEIFKAIDASLDTLVSANEHANLVLFSAHGMVSNVLDVSSMLMLPEFLYRMFIDKQGILATNDGHLANRPATDYPRHWSDELWMRRKIGVKQIDSPSKQRIQGDSLAWQAANWYSPLWPEMPAFALPSYSDGYIRINLCGRDNPGLIEPSEYHALCQRITDNLLALKNPKTGSQVVRKVHRTRANAHDNSPKHADADLVVCWQDGDSFDTLSHPDLGRFGPVPYFRTGGHRNYGFASISGPEIESECSEPQHALSLTPTLLALMGVPIPDYMATPFSIFS